MSLSEWIDNMNVNGLEIQLTDSRLLSEWFAEIEETLHGNHYLWLYYEGKLEENPFYAEDLDKLAITKSWILLPT